MDFFQYQHHQLMAENLPVKQLAEQFGTPLYIYSKATLERHWHAFDKAFGEHPHLVCYAVKSNPNIAILNVMAKLGSGFDICVVKGNWNAYWPPAVIQQKWSFPVWRNPSRKSPARWKLVSGVST